MCNRVTYKLFVSAHYPVTNRSVTTLYSEDIICMSGSIRPLPLSLRMIRI